MIYDPAQGEGEGDGQQLLLQDGLHLPVTVNCTFKVESCPGHLHFVPHGGHALPHPYVGLQLRPNTQVRAALLIEARV